ncbi:MAG: hypothetical protein OXQ29_03725 [Rhodospirillaceae bacterium]|nr:hypothetical protein [Rhodospirillaceae bacterium]
MKIGYDKDTNLYPRGNASPLVKVDEHGMVDGKLLYPPWWPRFTEALIDGCGVHKAAKRVGVDTTTVIRWRKKCQHLEQEIETIREIGRQHRYETVREAQRKHLTLAERLRDDLAADPDMAGNAAKVRLFDAVTRALDVERRAAEPPRGMAGVMIQNTQVVGDPGVKAVYTDAEEDEITRVLREANGELPVVEGEIVENAEVS